MSTTNSAISGTIQIPASLKLVGIIGSLWVLFTIIGASTTFPSLYLDFSPFNKYLSDIGDTPEWSNLGGGY